MAKHNNPAQEQTPEQIIESLSATVAAQEATITELINKIDALEGRIKTGHVTVEHGGAQYKVIGAKVPTFKLTADASLKTVPAEELSKYPEVIAALIAKGSGLLQKIES